MSPSAPRLLDQVRAAIRLKHYSLRTEQAYLEWIKRYIGFHHNRHPSALGSADVVRFLTHLAAERNVAASTQNQAQSALLFLYREVLATELPMLDGVTRAKAPARLPVVLSKADVLALLDSLTGIHRLFGQLLYGSGLRIMEGVRLRVKDVDLGGRAIVVRDGKGAKDRITMLADRLVRPLRQQLGAVRRLHEMDLRDGYGSVWLPHALARHRSSQRYRPPSSHQRPVIPARAPRGAAAIGRRQARHTAHAAPLVRNTSAAIGHGHPNGAGTARSQRCEHDDDLHARSEGRRRYDAQPAGHSAAVPTSGKSRRSLADLSK